MPTASTESGVLPQGGFRLQHLEVRNWGTFHQHIWKISPAGSNALLTGDIGSGKSTLVDGITTLLVPKPANQIVFNKAAGAESQERTLTSYVKGEYKSDKDETTASARAISLRDDHSYSVLLAQFANDALEQVITIAQLFYFKDKGGKVERLFIVANTEMNIRDHFGEFENIAQLKCRLRKQNVFVSGRLKEYATSMRRALGIQNDRALDLFYQTVSLKSVDNLTQFVRQHMLEPGNSQLRVTTLCQSFEDLDRAHAAVVRAREQIDALLPIANDGDELQQLVQELESLRLCRNLLETWRAHHESSLEQQLEQKLLDELNILEQQLKTLANEIQHLQEQESSIQSSLDDNGGRRLQEIEHELSRQDEQLNKRKQYEQQYQQIAESLTLPKPNNAADFLKNKKDIEQLNQDFREQTASLDNDRTQHEVEHNQVNEKVEELNKEILVLEKRTDNIPGKMLALRQLICESLNLSEQELPFAGELIQVLNTEQAWEGAIERVLHNFGLSLLVQENHYTAVADYVNKTNLRGRVVYFRIIAPQQVSDLRALSLQSLVRKLQIKDDSPCYNWLLNRLVERFDFQCCDKLEEFRRNKYAITHQGQIKSGGDRHEKDDRHDLHNRLNYVLGWDNRDKLRALEQQRTEQINIESGIDSQISLIKEQLRKLTDRSHACTALGAILHFEDIDWQSCAKKIDVLQQERQQIESDSEVLQKLQTRLKDVKLVRIDKEKRRINKQQDKANTNSKLKLCQENQAEAQTILSDMPVNFIEQFLPLLENQYQTKYTDGLTLKNIKLRERELRSTLQRDIDNGDDRYKKLSARIIKQMADYKNTYKVETQEVDANIEALEEYLRMLAELNDDDLPRFEATFKQELNEKTIQSLVHFSTQLERAETELKQKITRINQSLTSIDYNEGSYIQLLAENINDVDIRQFRQDLRSCVSESLADDLYDEDRFLQVKAIIERFRGREGETEADKRWTKKVTDVRNWFVFSAEELWREDNSRRDYFESSSGKSGGQKEKLAYTILASALAYQFGLDQKENIRSYRFVVIDEAFGRGSETSTRYALSLFKELGLQLLVVTPLQKIHVIEPFIHHVHFVHNQDGKDSQIRNMTIAEYQDEKEKHQMNELMDAVETLQ